MATGRKNFILYEDEAEVLVESVARGLNSAGIPCVLWGHFLMHTHGIPTFIFWLDFVVPDASLAAASHVLATGQFSQPLLPCPDPADCEDGSSPERSHPITAFHMHIEGVRGHRSTSSVCLHRQSETLWFLPPLEASLASPRAGPLPPYLALACDKTALPPFKLGMGQGAFRSDETVVLVPKAHIYAEALMRIMARDDDKRVGTYAVAHFLYIEQYVRGRGIFDVGLLPRPFGELYEEFVSDQPLKNTMAKLKRLIGIPVDAKYYG